MADNIFKKFIKGDAVIKTTNDINIEVDNETLMRMALAIIAILFINIMLIKLLNK